MDPLHWPVAMETLTPDVSGDTRESPLTEPDGLPESNLYIQNAR